MKVKDLVNCPDCGAEVFYSCMTPAGKGKCRNWRTLHKARIRLAREMRLLMEKIERRTTGRLWGARRFFTPRLLRTVFGDGKKFLCLSSINVRPAYWVVRIDSGWSTSNWERNDKLKLPCDWLEDVYQAIEHEFGTGEKENGGLYAKARFPQACSLGDGTSWDEMEQAEVEKLLGKTA